MAAKCAFRLPGGALCEAKRSAPIHLRITPNHHDYADPSKAGLKAVSDGRAAYQRSEAHRTAYEGATGSVCLAAEAGAPGTCFGPLTPHHVAPRSLVGGLEQADAWGVVTVCARHNGAIQDDAATRAWAERTYTTVRGRDVPFLVTNEWLTAERERGVRL